MIYNTSFKTIAFVSTLILSASAWSVAKPMEEEIEASPALPATSQSTPLTEEIKQEIPTSRIGQTLNDFPMFGTIKDETKANGFLMKNHPAEAQGNALYFDQDPQNQGMLYATLNDGSRVYFNNHEGQVHTFTRGIHEGNGTIAKKASGELNPDRDYSEKSQFVQNRDRVVNTFKNLF